MNTILKVKIEEERKMKTSIHIFHIAVIMAAVTAHLHSQNFMESATLVSDSKMAHHSEKIYALNTTPVNTRHSSFLTPAADYRLNLEKWMMDESSWLTESGSMGLEQEPNLENWMMEDFTEKFTNEGEDGIRMEPWMKESTGWVTDK